ncbi:hypothetical protein TWF696_000293 [Orbilia brochopaga]|uniref:Methyltransferase domain-containing protein n=1 Tax=Orbilia brochopaga TaxID=3140254 RepID=A0AAV9VAV9_9PEZI
MPPSFGDKDYWDARFARDPSHFDWLLPADALDNAITQALTFAPSDDEPHILHIGCGTSSLSFHLRDLVKSPSQVHNVDFSAAAIDAGKAQEATELESLREHMRWSVADLLSFNDILALTRPGKAAGSYRVIVEKSTADAISCAEDVSVPIPYPLTAGPGDENKSIQGALSDTALVYPVYLLAVHMAFLVPPGGRWLALSYSSTRFSFLTSKSTEDYMMPTEGFPDPRLLWRIAGEEALDAPQAESKGGSVVKPPAVKHILYTLVRTAVPLVLRPFRDQAPSTIL